MGFFDFFADWRGRGPCTTCFACATIPCTCCFGFFEYWRLQREHERYQRLVSSPPRPGTRPAFEDSGGSFGTLDSMGNSPPSSPAPPPPLPMESPMSFPKERRAWREVLIGTGLREVAPLVWAFLDNHPHALRYASIGECKVIDLSLRKRDVDSGNVLCTFLHDVVGDAYCFFCNGSYLAYGLGHCLAVVKVDSTDISLEMEESGNPFAAGGTPLRNHTASSSSTHPPPPPPRNTNNTNNSSNSNRNTNFPRVQSNNTNPTDGNVIEEREDSDLGIMFTGHTAAVTCAAVSPDNRLIATGSSDESVRLWSFSPTAMENNLYDPLCLHEFTATEWTEWTGTLHLGHVCPLTAIAVTDLSVVVSGDERGNVAKWTENGQCTMFDAQHNSGSAVSCIVVDKSQSGKMLFAVGHADGFIRVGQLSDCTLVGHWNVGHSVLAMDVTGYEMTIVTPKTLLYAVAGRRDPPIEVCRFSPRATHAVIDTEKDLVCISTHNSVRVFTRGGQFKMELPVTNPGIRCAILR